MPVSLDASRSFTDYRSSRIINQNLINKIGDQPIGVALWNNDYTELGSPDNLLLSTIEGAGNSAYRRHSIPHRRGCRHSYPPCRECYGYYNRRPRENIFVAPVILMPNPHASGEPNPENSGSSMVKNKFVPWGDEATESPEEKIREANWMIKHNQDIIAARTTGAAASGTTTPASGAAAATGVPATGYRRNRY